MFFGKGKEFKERVISTGFRWIETLSLNPGSQARQDFAGFKTKVLKEVCDGMGDAESFKPAY
jgi:hypothetical protein